MPTSTSPAPLAPLRRPFAPSHSAALLPFLPLPLSPSPRPSVFRRAALRAVTLAAFAAFAALPTLAPALRAQPPLAPGEVQIERTMLPEAHAGSFAFGLPGGVNVCYDPVRGGVNYVWTGGFIDLTNVRPINKLIKAAALLGPVVYRESGSLPLRRGDAARAPVVEFKGYSLRDSAVELRYTVDGVPVAEELRAAPDRSALLRTFRFDRTAADAQWWFVVEGRPAQAIVPRADGTFVLTVPLAAAPSAQP